MKTDWWNTEESARIHNMMADSFKINTGSLAGDDISPSVCPLTQSSKSEGGGSGVIQCDGTQQDILRRHALSYIQCSSWELSCQLQDSAAAQDWQSALQVIWGYYSHISFGAIVSKSGVFPLQRAICWSWNLFRKWSYNWFVFMYVSMQLIW